MERYGISRKAVVDTIEIRTAGNEILKLKIEAIVSHAADELEMLSQFDLILNVNAEDVQIDIVVIESPLPECG